MNVIKELMPNVEHRNCAQHIWANWKKYIFKELFWDVVKCPNKNS